MLMHPDEKHDSTVREIKRQVRAFQKPGDFSERRST
jgi:hypothetical protein